MAGRWSVVSYLTTIVAFAFGWSRRHHLLVVVKLFVAFEQRQFEAFVDPKLETECCCHSLKSF